MSSHPLKIILVTLILTGSPIPGGAVFAAEMIPGNPARVTDEKIHQLEELHQKAEEHILKNDFRSAIRFYEDILLEEPDDETAYTGMAQCLMVLGDFSRAKEAYWNALHINPNNETAQRGLKKIADPDSMNFPISSSRVSENADTTTIPSPIPAQKPAGPPIDDIHLGARKSMAPYSVEIPKPLKELNRNQLVQTALKNAGFYRGPVDGMIGPVTRKAIRDFQKMYDLDPDGKVGPKTWELLQPYLDSNGFEAKA